MTPGQRILIWTGSTILVLLGIGFLTAYLLYSDYYRAGMETPLDPDAGNRRFVVAYGQSFSAVALNLADQGFIADSRVLKIHARLHSDQTSVKAGEYELSASMTPEEILEKLLSGRVITYVTFPEGLTLTEMAEIWDASGFGTREEFLQASARYRDADLETPPTGWEGYLFPETYVFTAEFTEDQLVERMIDQFKRIMRPEWISAAREQNLSLHDVVTLASLVEEETRIPEERPLVSAVFHNRLKKGMLLQCDPTVIYALGNRYTGRLLKKHLALDLPYNTYVYPGLPPGPIASPGAGSLAAACFPADVDYLYFVADNTGGHRFSRSLAEHNRAVRAYRDGLRTGNADG